MPRTGRGKPKIDRVKSIEASAKEYRDRSRKEKAANANINAIFKQGDKEFAKESNKESNKAPGSNAKKKHTNKGSAGVRKGYNPNTNAFRQLQDKETGELSKKQEIYHYKSFFDDGLYSQARRIKSYKDLVDK